MRSPSCGRSLNLNLVPQELAFKVYIDALLFNGADRRVLRAEPYFCALPMTAAVTFPSWSTSPSTLPRAAGCLMQRCGLRWLRACVMDPSSTNHECVRWICRVLSRCVVRELEWGNSPSPACSACAGSKVLPVSAVIFSVQSQIRLAAAPRARA